MARKQQRKLREEDLQGFKYFKILGPLLESLHEVGTQRGNRSRGETSKNKGFFKGYGVNS